MDIAKIARKGFVVIVLLVGFCYPSFAQETTYQDWIRLKESVHSNWTVIPNENDPLRITIRPKYAQNSGEVKKVLVLFPKKSSAYNTAISKILDILADKKILADITVINFKGKPNLGRVALRYAKLVNFDLIYSMGSTTTAFVVKRFKNEAIPVVSVCSKDPVLMGQMDDYEKGSGTNLAFTSLNVPIQVQITYLKSLIKNLKNIGVLYATKNASAVITQVEPLRQAAQWVDINVIDIAVEDQSNAAEELKQKIPQGIEKMKQNDPELKHSIFWITGSTSVFRELSTINAYSKNVPVLSVVPDLVKEGSESALLSIGVSFDSNAHLAAIYGTMILTKRAKAGKLTVGVVEPPDISINFNKVRAIGLKIPFSFFESANFIYDYDGKLVRSNGRNLVR